MSASSASNNNVQNISVFGRGQWISLPSLCSHKEQGSTALAKGSFPWEGSTGTLFLGEATMCPLSFLPLPVPSVRHHTTTQN
jgi:hypothetical protein